MNPNYLYFLQKAKSIAELRPNLKILDYGCGRGEIVVAGRKEGLDIYGSDIFYEGDRICIEELKKNNLLGDAILEIENNRIPFPDEMFDLVISNQVFEHVEDLEKTLSEIYRVMKPGAFFISRFPTKEIFFEGHIGIPFCHWFSKKSKIRYYYTLFLRTLNFGYHKGNKSNTQWTKDALEWIDKYTHYRKRFQIIEDFENYFEIDLKETETDYLRYRISQLAIRKGVFNLLSITIVVRSLRFILHQLTGIVIKAKKVK